MKADRCYNCKSPERICKVLVVFWGAVDGIDTEIILVDENLGFKNRYRAAGILPPQVLLSYIKSHTDTPLAAHLCGFLLFVQTSMVIHS